MKKKNRPLKRDALLIMQIHRNAVGAIICCATAFKIAGQRQSGSVLSSFQNCTGLRIHGWALRRLHGSTKRQRRLRGSQKERHNNISLSWLAAFDNLQVECALHFQHREHNFGCRSIVSMMRVRLNPICTCALDTSKYIPHVFCVP